jgi:hypothetical protein
MVTYKELYLKAFPPSVPSLLTDRKGNELTAGGDTEYVMRLIWMGYELHYDERLKFIHFISKERLTEAYRDKLFNGFRQSAKILLPYSRQCEVALLNMLETPVFMIKTLLRGLLSRFFGFKQYDFRNEFLLFFHLTGFSFISVDADSRLVRKMYGRLKALKE